MNICISVHEYMYTWINTRIDLHINKNEQK
jgi:hypothetical protein